MQQKNKYLLTGAELADVLGEKPLTIRNWRRIGLIPFLSLGYRSVRYDPDKVLAALRRREVKEVGAARREV
jgi:hypothetical protein